MPLIIAGTEEQKKKYLGAPDRASPFSRVLLLRARRRLRRRRHAHARRRSTATTTSSTARSAGSPTAASPSFYTVFATFDPAMKHKGIACFVVDANTPGVKVGKKENKMGQRASNTTDVIFEDVQASPKSALVGERGRRLQGRDEDVRPHAPVDRRRRRRHHPARARREPRATRSSARPSACRSRSTRPCSSCSPRWRSPTRRRACSCTRRRGWSTRASLDAIVSSYAKAYGADAAMRVADRRRPDLRRLRLHEGVPGREADARREAAADLRGHRRRSSASSSRATCSGASSFSLAC